MVPCLRVNGKRKYLGYFSDPKEAKRVYQIAAKNIMGNFIAGGRIVEGFYVMIL